MYFLFLSLKRKFFSTWKHISSSSLNKGAFEKKKQKRVKKLHIRCASRASYSKQKLRKNSSPCSELFPYLSHSPDAVWTCSWPARSPLLPHSFWPSPPKPPAASASRARWARPFGSPLKRKNLNSFKTAKKLMLRS